MTVDMIANPVLTGIHETTAYQVIKHLRVLQRRYRARDQRWEDVRSIRRGEFDQFPDLMSDAFPKPIVQNFIDTAARDLAEMLAPLPSFNCSQIQMNSDAERKRADMRTKIANNYIFNSHMSEQMLYAADQYFTYGMTVFIVEPNYEEKLPMITVDDPHGGYPEWDRWGRLVTYTKRFFLDAHVLADLYPEYADTIMREARNSAGKESEWQVEMVRYWDDYEMVLIFGQKHPFVLDRIKNKTNRIPIVVAKRPWLDPLEIRGQFDDVVWIQLARDGMAKLQYEAVEKAVQAPLALPNDVQDLGYGPDSIMRSATPEKIRRVGMEMTNMTFLENNTLQQDMQAGARYPAARMGEMDASIITGRGVQALMGGLDAQIRGGQTVLKQVFIDLIDLCFRMDEKMWPDFRKKVRGMSDGIPYEIEYTPSKAINGDYSCDVEYGFAAGLDPNRAIVLLLQLRAEKVFSRDYMARQVPFDIDVTSEQAKIAVEETREALLQAIFGYVQAIPALAQSGMDPSDAVQKVSAIVKGLQKGRSVEDVVSRVFAPPELPPELSGADLGGTGEPGAGGPGGPGGGLNPSGLMSGVPAGQAGMAPGGRPDLSMMLAGISPSGKPQLSASVMRRRRV